MTNPLRELEVLGQRVVLQNLTGEHEGQEASLPVQLKLPLQTGWR
jgi:hypothetical protein